MALSSIVETPSPPQCVVIVGGGIAGLTAARTLLQKSNTVSVTLLEASDRLGGRIRGEVDFVPGHVLDLGAEFIHGKGTVLTELIQEYSEEWERRIRPSTLLQEIFITAHADGGPSPEPTADGYYGMYYVNKELLRYDDVLLEPLHRVLEGMEHETFSGHTSDMTSLGDVLCSRLKATPELSSLAVAGYANTAGCSDLRNISLPMTLAFEEHWEAHEIAGDHRIHSSIGMYGLVQKLVDELESHEQRFTAHLNWRVCSISQDCNSSTAVLRSVDGEAMHADAVVVAVPPPLLPTLGLDLGEAKREALQYIGFDTAVKVVLKFSKQLWPCYLQSVVCADSIVPEMWFRHFPTSDDSEEDCHVVVCFFTSSIAETFLARVTDTITGRRLEDKMTELVIQQLSEMFNRGISDFGDAHRGTLCYSFGDHPTIRGGYVFPKVGMRRKHLKDLAKPQHRIFFAGEATNTNACCTVQAAMETGVRSANEVLGL